MWRRRPDDTFLDVLRDPRPERDLPAAWGRMAPFGRMSATFSGRCFESVGKRQLIVAVL